MKSVYHYTSIEKLALVLKNRNIAFKKLSTLDDPLEKYIVLDDSIKRLYKSKDGRVNLGDYCFVSCWSYEQEESIAMWDMYGDRKQGVRIELPDDMFDREYNIFESRDKINIRTLFETNPSLIFPSLIDVNYGKEDEAKVKLTDNIFDKLGKYKSKDWEFQKECRYILFGQKINNINAEVYYTSDMTINNSIGGISPLNTDTIYFRLSEEAISKISIMRGPSMSDGKKALLDSLVKSYGIPHEKIIDSKFMEA